MKPDSKTDSSDSQIQGISASAVPIAVHRFALFDYQSCWQTMREFSRQRDASSEDQLWLLQHPPVYTLGTACRHLPLANNNIPVVHTDRGGQITYHGPGQWVLYPLINLKRFGLGVKSAVTILEQAVINLLSDYRIRAARKKGAPGVYVDGQKIAALGLRVTRGNVYHGLSLNVDMDLTPFEAIDPCGYQGLKVTSMRQYTDSLDEEAVGQQLVNELLGLL